MAVKKVAGKNVGKVGLGAAAAVAAAAGYYFYASKNAAANRKQATQWATNFKKDVTKKVKESGVLDSKAVKKAISEVEKTYKGIKELDAKEVMKAAGELKNNWDTLAQEMENGFAKGKKDALGTAKKVVKAAKKKVAKK